jgi:hypothetical protein
VLLPVLVVALLPLATGVLRDQQQQAVTAGTPWHMVSRSALCCEALLVAAGSLGWWARSRTGRRRPARQRHRVWPAYWLMVLGTSGLALAVLVVERHSGQSTGYGYYLEKALIGVECLVLAGLGATANLLPRPPLRMTRIGGRLLGATPVPVVAVAIYAALGGLFGDSAWRQGPATDSYRNIAPYTYPAVGTMIDRVLAVPTPEAERTVLVFSADGYANYVVTLWIGVMRGRSGGDAARAVYAHILTTDEGSLRALLTITQGPVEIVTTTDLTAQLVRQFQVEHPQRDIQLVTLTG